VSRSFTKLFSSITESTVWCEPLATRVVWITMLAMADARGRVWASVPGLANRARVTVEEAEAALNRFLAPDRYSRTPDYEGRRIEVIDGGWILLNHRKYRELRDDDARREYQRQWVKEKRLRKVSTVDQCRPPSTQAEAEADRDKSLPSPNGEGVAGDAAPPAEAIPAKPKIPDCPHDAIVAAYHELLPDCPQVRAWTNARRTHLQARWREKAKPNGTTQGYATTVEGVAWWRKFFGYVAKSQFLTGRAAGRGDRPPFVANLAWLIKPENFAKVIEGNFHDAA